MAKPDEVSEWLRAHDLHLIGGLFQALMVIADDLSDLSEIEEEDICKVADALSMKLANRKKFRKAIASLSAGGEDPGADAGPRAGSDSSPRLNEESGPNTKSSQAIRQRSGPVQHRNQGEDTVIEGGGDDGKAEKEATSSAKNLAKDEGPDEQPPEGKDELMEQEPSPQTDHIDEGKWRVSVESRAHGDFKLSFARNGNINDPTQVESQRLILNLTGAVTFAKLLTLVAVRLQWRRVRQDPTGLAEQLDDGNHSTHLAQSNRFGKERLVVQEGCATPGAMHYKLEEEDMPHLQDHWHVEREDAETTRVLLGDEDGTEARLQDIFEMRKKNGGQATIRLQADFHEDMLKRMGTKVTTKSKSEDDADTATIEFEDTAFVRRKQILRVKWTADLRKTAERKDQICLTKWSIQDKGFVGSKTDFDFIKENKMKARYLTRFFGSSHPIRFPSDTTTATVDETSMDPCRTWVSIKTSFKDWTGRGRGQILSEKTGDSNFANNEMKAFSDLAKYVMQEAFSEHSSEPLDVY
jgi:hypothetical protein